MTAAKPSSKADILFLAYPLAAAIINPGTGLTSGFYAALFVFIYMAFRHGVDRQRIEVVELLAIVAAVIILLSPLWTDTPLATSLSPSRGAAVSVLYLLTVRWVIQQRADLVAFLRIISLICGVYAVYFLVNAQTVETSVGRLTVDFANANYTGAVLAFGAVVSLWLLIGDAAGKGRRVLNASAFVLQGWAVFETGSRASFAGLVGASTVLIFLRRTPLVAHRLTSGVLVAGFVIGFFAGSVNFFRAIAERLEGFDPFARADSAVYSASGREQIWRATREVVSESWLAGWGPDLYRLHASGQSPAHAWGLEFMASVGLVGTLVLAVLIGLCYSGRGQGAIGRPLPRRAALLNTVTALALVPNLVLSTHQWTLWAWAGIALWSRTYLLDEDLAATESERLTRTTSRTR